MTSFSDAGEGATIGFATARGRNWPTLRQFTVFLENRVGQLAELVRRFAGTKIRIVALSISDAGECAFVRFLMPRHIWQSHVFNRMTVRPMTDVMKNCSH